MIPATAIAVALLGAFNAGAAIRVFYRENLKERAVQPSGSACRSVFQTRHARALGLPNGVVGVVYYLIVIGLAIANAVGAPPVIVDGAAMLALIAAAFSIYLTYLLIFRLRMSCRICHTGNAINVVLAILWVSMTGWLSPAR